jgi:hypothetical protein
MSIPNPRQFATLLFALLIIPVGLYAKLYEGSGSSWVNNSLAGAFYEIFWCLTVFLLLPRSRPWLIALSVLAVTCILEFTQLWHPPFLESVRATFLGHALIGSEFAWTDFTYYGLGSAAGWLWLCGLTRIRS